jgi:uncharacterized protein (TIGR02145 family)
MKKTIILIMLAFIGLSNVHAQVGVGTTSPDPSAKLDVTSPNNDKGFLPPRLTTVQRDAIATPAEGLTIFNTTNGCLEFFNASYWVSTCDGNIASGPCIGEPTLINFNGKIYKPIAYDNNCWLDRNLGSSRVAQSFDDFEAYGDLYQWGRSRDGHQLINWTSSTSGSPVNDPESTTQSTNPSPGNTFIASGWGTNWYTGTSPDPDALWKENGTGVNNPCPTGYRVPTLPEMNNAILNAGPGVTANFNTSLKLTAVGYRSPNDGNLIDVSTQGNYWTSTINSTNAHRIRYSGASVSSSAVSRATGYSVRCIKD